MSTFSGQPVTIDRPAAEIASRFDDLSVMQSSLDNLSAEDRAKVGEVKFEKDNIYIQTNQVGQIQFSITERSAERITMTAVGSPVPLTLSVLLLSLDGFDLVTTFTSVATCLNNVGPGLEMVGPMGSFADFSAPAKLLLAFDMLAGRLELYPMLALFAPRLWRKRINAMHEARAK